jgi:hypothetical protein
VLIFLAFKPLTDFLTTPRHAECNLRVQFAVGALIDSPAAAWRFPNLFKLLAWLLLTGRTLK